jgi:hypothetical protein
MMGQQLRQRSLGAWTCLVAVAAAPLLMPTSALAQWFGDGIMPPQAIGRIVMRQGFSEFSPPRLAGDVYIVHAVDEDGARVRLVIDAYNGRILRPLRAVERVAPSRPLERMRPQDDEDGIEREYIAPRRPPNVERDTDWEREALVPPRSIPRGSPPDRSFPREARIDPPTMTPEPQARPAKKPAPNRRTSRVEQPAREIGAPAGRKPHETRRSNPATVPAAPAPVVEAPKPGPAADTGSAPSAAVTPPAAPNEAAAVTPSAPRAAIEPAKPPETATVEASQETNLAPPAQVQPAPQPAPTASASGAPVRVIEGVTPILPQDSASAPK